METREDYQAFLEDSTLLKQQSILIIMQSPCTIFFLFSVKVLLFEKEQQHLDKTQNWRRKIDPIMSWVASAETKLNTHFEIAPDLDTVKKQKYELEVWRVITLSLTGHRCTPHILTSPSLSLQRNLFFFHASSSQSFLGCCPSISIISESNFLHRKLSAKNFIPHFIAIRSAWVIVLCLIEKDHLGDWSPEKDCWTVGLKSWEELTEDKRATKKGDLNNNIAT